MTTRPFLREDVFIRVPPERLRSGRFRSMPDMLAARRHSTADPDFSARCLLHFLVGVRVVDPFGTVAGQSPYGIQMFFTCTA
jgi:hypothetical protein